MSAEPTTPRPASTVMVVRAAGAGIEVFMARRSAQSPFMPDAYVFPGGAVDAADAQPEAIARLDRVPAGVEPQFAVAAVRELCEEVGMLLAARADGLPLEGREVNAVREVLASGGRFNDVVAERDLRLTGSAIAYYSRWVTPADVKRRFDTRFFVARAPAGQTAAADAFEMHDGVWIAPADALERGASGEWTLVFPTIRHLERLAQFATVEALFEHAGARRPQPVTPVVGGDGIIRLPLEADAW